MRLTQILNNYRDADGNIPASQVIPFVRDIRAYQQEQSDWLRLRNGRQLEELVNMAEKVIKSADNTGCSGDLTVVDKEQLDMLEDFIVNQCCDDDNHDGADFSQPTDWAPAKEVGLGFLIGLIAATIFTIILVKGW